MYCVLRNLIIAVLLCRFQDTNKKIRAGQRRAIIQEVQDKDLTFSPAINQKSIDVRTLPLSKRVGRVLLSSALLQRVCPY